jgi:hypothetical protein
MLPCGEWNAPANYTHDVLIRQLLRTYYSFVINILYVLRNAFSVAM